PGAWRARWRPYSLSSRFRPSHYTFYTIDPRPAFDRARNGRGGNLGPTISRTHTVRLCLVRRHRRGLRALPILPKDSRLVTGGCIQTTRKERDDVGIQRSPGAGGPLLLEDPQELPPRHAGRRPDLR